MCVQAVMETVGMTLQAAELLALGSQIWGWIDGHGLLKVLIDEYIANPAATAAARLGAMTTIASLVGVLLAEPTAKEPLGEECRQQVGEMHMLIGGCSSICQECTVLLCCLAVRTRPITHA